MYESVIHISIIVLCIVNTTSTKYTQYAHDRMGILVVDSFTTKSA